MLLVLLSAGLLVLSSAQSTDNDVITEGLVTVNPAAEGPSQSQGQERQGPPPDDGNQAPPPSPPTNQQGPTPLGGPDRKSLPPTPGNRQRPPPPPRGCVHRAHPKVNYSGDLKVNDRKSVRR
ncbi:basic salivary proline-rich protein 4 [Dasypus novemcinctus]|uniref:basic salivary proline-rich protein 4 n=1 Tax=Dasypus novemcinctus TaxID=9361 RepID=UPI0039C90C5A